MKNYLIRWKIEYFLFVIIVLPFVIPILQGKVIYWGTVSLQFIPWSSFAIDSLTSGVVPLWNPYNGMGAPFMANYQTAIFYPINWLLIPFYKFQYFQGLAIGYSFLLIGHFVFSAIGFSKILKLFHRSEFAQVLGSISWVFGGYIISRISFISMVWAFSWVSWILYYVLLIRHSTDESKLKTTLWLTFLLLMQLLTGHAQTFAFTTGFSIILLLFPFENKIKIILKNFLLYFTAIIISIGMAAIQIVPTFEYLIHSQRSSEVGFEYATNFSFWPLRIFSTLFGNFWGNPGLDRYFGGGSYWEDQIYHGAFAIIFVFLVILKLFRSNERNIFREYNKIIIVLFSVLIISFFIALGENYFLFPFLYAYFPGISLFQGPSRFLIFYSFAISIIISFGFDYWKQKTFNLRKIGLLTVFSLAILIASILVFFMNQSIPMDIFISIWISAGLMAIFSAFTILKTKYPEINSHIIPSLVVLFFYIDLVLINFPYGHFVFKDYFPAKLSDPSDKHVEKMVYIDSETETFLKFNSFFRFDRFQFLEQTIDKYPSFIPNANLGVSNYYSVNNFDPFMPERYFNFKNWLQGLSLENQKRVLSYFGVNQILTLDVNSITGYREIEIFPEKFISWFDCSFKIPPGEILDGILKNIDNDLQNNCVYIEKDLTVEKLYEKTIENSIEIHYIKLNNGKIEIKYKSNFPGWIVIRQVWYPGWKAVIDNSEVLEIHQVDYMFQGVYVPEGDHKLLITYKPISFLVGSLISCISLAVFFVAIIARNKQKNNKL